MRFDHIFVGRMLELVSHWLNAVFVLKPRHFSRTLVFAIKHLLK